VETATSGSLFHWDPITYLIAGLIALVVGIADEIHQTYIPTRNGSVGDVLLDVVGIVLCLVFFKRFEQMSGFSKIRTFLHRNK
jgi:VanZ family protein